MGMWRAVDREAIEEQEEGRFTRENNLLLLKIVKLCFREGNFLIRISFGGLYIPLKACCPLVAEKSYSLSFLR